MISSGDASEIDELAKLQKRHSTGDRDYASERLLRPQSAFLFDSRDNLDGTRSLPRSIWKHGKLHIIHENLLSRTKYLENNKKVRKNWTTSWAVLTESHLSFFKDQKCLNAQNIKSELEVDLHYSRIEANSDKSSRKNVFQITCYPLGLELLCQTPNPTDSLDWCVRIQKVIESLPQPEDVQKFKGKTDYLEVFSGDNTVKRRSTMKSSTKVKITTPEEDDKNKIRAQLKKFFHRRPPRDSLVKKGIYKDEPVFGCLLEKLAQNDRSPIPLFVDDCINVIESKEENLKTDGIYRASGNLSQVQKIRLQVDQNNLAILHSEDDVHVLAGALKLFFREMREPIIPSSLFDRFLRACHMPHKEDKEAEFQSLIKALPKPNYATLKRLLAHLLKVADYSEFNRMQVPNLAIVFGPTLMWNNIESANMAIDLMQQNYVVEILLNDFDALFS
ncbi:unnamed protein product [Allacma fusca]|uniref:Rho GTPase-activating protein 15 n=1 Tax=Allacma fusca TaxID=39272 RepID=A0A8J2LQ05_9HEXA|nr:unnamed protein product [Allacma fusca]